MGPTHPDPTELAHTLDLDVVDRLAGGPAVAGRERRAGQGVSGSGDVRAGITAGSLARGASADRAAVWAAHLHGRAGERLAASVEKVGFLARELLVEAPRARAEIEV